MFKRFTLIVIISFLLLRAYPTGHTALIMGAEEVATKIPPVAVEIIEEIEIEIVEEIQPPDNLRYSKFDVSYYCSCYECTQNTLDVGRTASGEYARAWITVATPNDIPFNSIVFIEGLGEFIVQDRGGYIQYTTDTEGNTVMRIDIYLDSHAECLERGRHYSDGYILLD